MVFKKFYVKKTSVKMSCNPYKDINECQEEQGLCGDHGRCVNLVSMIIFRDYQLHCYVD